MTRTISNHLRPLAASLALVVGLAAVVACQPVAPATVGFAGHGWGHGRGMGQFGAYGYAVDHGWTGSQILDRFYAGTVTARAADARQRVFLTAQEGKDLIVTNTLGRLRVSANDYASDFAAIRIRRVDSGHFKLYTGKTCAGPWSGWTSLRTATAIRVRPPAHSDDPRAMLQVCGPVGTRYYRGDLLAVRVGPTIETVNDIGIEDQIRSVIAKEISPSWADAGNGRGAAAVRAQAVAARSYAMAGDTRFAPWATTCDSTLCQVYGGYGTRAATSTSIVKVEDPRTDTAVLITRLQVRRSKVTGAIARTEFSSSTGGYTAGGAFPLARDDGDDTSLNPNHDWTATVDRTAIEAAFDKREGKNLGTLEGIDVTGRNGHGDMGGRVTSVRVRFASGTVALTGSQFRSTMGLKSDWFKVTTQL